MYSANMVKTAVDIVIGDDGFRSKEVLEVLKDLKKDESHIRQRHS